MNKPDGQAVPKPCIYFSYLDSKGFSGQRAATEMVINGLATRGWHSVRLPQPALDRAGGRGVKIAYLARVLSAWIRGVRLLSARDSWFCLNLAQTRVGMLRESVNVLMARAGMGRERIVISLHGSPFMHWPARSAEMRLFSWLLAQVGTVTVLGEKQRERLLQMGVAAEKVRVVVNSCDLEPIGMEALARKLDPKGVGVVRLLHLSSLIDTKGYPEFLEALANLAQSKGTRIEAVLCGKLVAAEQNERFSNLSEAEAWIEKMVAEINRSERVSVRWVKGAMGEEKRQLFHEADIFVLPTHYAVEAQPLVLLEAMASGCAIVTTQVGEILTILDETCARLLEDAEVAGLTREIDKLSESEEMRERMARQAHQRFLDRYQVERHLDVWEQILSRANDTE